VIAAITPQRSTVSLGQASSRGNAPPEADPYQIIDGVQLSRRRTLRRRRQV